MKKWMNGLKDFGVCVVCSWPSLKHQMLSHKDQLVLLELKRQTRMVALRASFSQLQEALALLRAHSFSLQAGSCPTQGLLSPRGQPVLDQILTPCLNWDNAKWPPKVQMSLQESSVATTSQLNVSSSKSYFPPSSQLWSSLGASQ